MVVFPPLLLRPSSASKALQPLTPGLCIGGTGHLLGILAETRTENVGKKTEAWTTKNEKSLGK